MLGLCMMQVVKLKKGAGTGSYVRISMQLFICEILCSPFLPWSPFPPRIPFLPSASLGCHGFDDHLASNQEGGKSKNVVNLGAIRQGMKRFQFLLNCCEPGTIPDASILAAALDLVSLCAKLSLTYIILLSNNVQAGAYWNTTVIRKGW